MALRSRASATPGTARAPPRAGSRERARTPTADRTGTAPTSRSARSSPCSATPRTLPTTSVTTSTSPRAEARSGVRRGTTRTSAVRTPGGASVPPGVDCGSLTWHNNWWQLASGLSAGNVSAARHEPDLHRHRSEPDHVGRIGRPEQLVRRQLLRDLDQRRWPHLRARRHGGHLLPARRLQVVVLPGPDRGGACRQVDRHRPVGRRRRRHRGHLVARDPRAGCHQLRADPVLLHLGQRHDDPGGLHLRRVVATVR